MRGANNLSATCNNFRLRSPARAPTVMYGRFMQDPLTGKQTYLQGGYLPGAAERQAVLDDHWKRLRALDQLVQTAGECDIRADKDRDFVRLPEDEVSLLELAGGPWARFGEALREFRRCLPLIGLDTFGFDVAADAPLDVNTLQIFRIGGGVEALAFEGPDQSIYKFYFFREGGDIGATFHFSRYDDAALQATAAPGSYRLLLLKLIVIHEIGMPTEVVGVSPEGILIVKQTLGEILPQGLDMSDKLPAMLIPIPSRFLRADRDHPRILFFEGEPWLIADLHARNFARCADGKLRVIDLVAARWPVDQTARDPLMQQWLERIRADPAATLLPGAPDDEL